MKFTSMKFIRTDEILFLLFWCSGYIGAKIGIPLSGTFTILFYRYAIVLLIVAIIVAIKQQWRKPDSSVFVIGFFAHFVWLVVILKSFEYGMNAGAAALIAAMQPALTALIAPVILNEKNNARQWFGIFLGFIGVCVFVGSDATFSGTALWVYWLPCIATLSLTGITLLERRQNARSNNAKHEEKMPIMTALFWQAAITLVLLAPLAFWFENFYADWSVEFVFAVVWLAIIVSTVAYAMMYQLIRTRAATRVSSLQYFVPPVTMFIAFLVFQEKLSGYGFLGLLITSIGFYFLHQSASSSKRRSRAAR